MTDSNDVDPTEGADQIMNSTKPSRTLHRADAAGVDLLALEQRTAKGRRPGLDDYVTGVEEDHAVAPMVVERLSRRRWPPLQRAAQRTGMPELTTSTEPHSLDSDQ